MDVNILLFPEFETLDAFGPAEVFGRTDGYRPRYVSAAGGAVSSRQGARVLTGRAGEANLRDILLIPGGQGTRVLVNDTGLIEELARMAALSEYCLTVCTGSALLAKTGLLDGRRATSNKLAFEWVKSAGPNVRWVERARWVADGKYRTSSGVSAGIDMSLGFVAERLGVEKARAIAREIEYVWNADPQNDPFAV